MMSEARRAEASFAMFDASGTVIKSGEAEAVIGDGALNVGPVTVSFLDADQLKAADYALELHLWPAGRLILSQLGRRFDTFTQELRRVRNQARIAGLLAHGISTPEVYPGAVLSDAGARASEFHVYDTHVTVVPVDGDPWQLPLGSVTDVRWQREPPGIALETSSGATILGQLARQREACHAAIVERREAQRRLLAVLTEQSGFSDGRGLAQSEIRAFDQLLERFTAPNRLSCSGALLAVATRSPRLGFVQLLDPDGDALSGPAALPENWAAFLLVPVGPLTVLEILAGPAAATYVFRGEIDAVNRDLQVLHFRRAPLALTAKQAELTPGNPHRLALRRLEPLHRLRSVTEARLVHDSGWEAAFEAAIHGAQVGLPSSSRASR